MFAHLTTRSALTATTAIVALGVVIALPQLMQQPLSGNSGTVELRRGAPADQADETAARSERDTIAMASEEQPNAAPVQDAAPLPAPTTDAAGSGSQALQPMAVPESRMLSKKSVPIANRPGSGLIGRPIPADDRFQASPEPNTEAFPETDPNPLKITSEAPVSTFSIDVDTAAYAIVRSSISAGQLPPKDAVRIEEMVNYFPYDYPAPAAGEAPFKPTVTVIPTPWNEGTELVHIAIQGREPATDDRPPLNLVFLIDTSGSMNQPNKLPLLKHSLMLMLPRLDARDRVAIVTYAGSAGLVLPPTPASHREAIANALDHLRAGGSTAGQAGLQQAYSVAAGMAEDGEVTRVILATDGDFNVGLSDPEALKDFIADKRDSGTYLSVLGFGRGNLDDATMQALAQNGNGQAAYIDTLSEAQKVLVDQFSGALFPIADDVKIQVEFNPAEVAEYRLLGYETRHLAREDFNNDKVDAGDIGAGTSVTAIYEITPVGSPARLSDPLRYGDPQAVTDAAPELGYLKLRYKEPGQDRSRLIEAAILPELGEETADMRFGVAIAGFGELLRKSTFVGNWTYDDAITLAEAGAMDDPFGYRAEAIRLMRLADSLSR